MLFAILRERRRREAPRLVIRQLFEVIRGHSKAKVTAGNKGNAQRFGFRSILGKNKIALREQGNATEDIPLHRNVDGYFFHNLQENLFQSRPRQNTRFRDSRRLERDFTAATNLDLERKLSDRKVENIGFSRSALSLLPHRPFSLSSSSSPWSTSPTESSPPPTPRGPFSRLACRI